VTAGDRGRVNLDDIVVATEDVFADSQRQPPAVLQQPTEARGLAQARRFGDEGRLSTKRIPEPVRGPDESRVARIIAERVADLGDETGEIRFRDECRGPQKLVQLVLRHRAGSMFHQDSQKLECLRRQMDLAVRPDKLSGIGVEGEFAKPKFHTALIETHESPEVAQDCRRERLHISGSGGGHEGCLA